MADLDVTDVEVIKVKVDTVVTTPAGTFTIFAGEAEGIPQIGTTSITVDSLTPIRCMLNGVKSHRVNTDIIQVFTTDKVRTPTV